MRLEGDKCQYQSKYLPMDHHDFLGGEKSKTKSLFFRVELDQSRVIQMLQEASIKVRVCVEAILSSLLTETTK